MSRLFEVDPASPEDAEPAIMALLETARGYGNLELDLASGALRCVVLPS